MSNRIKNINQLNFSCVIATHNRDEFLKKAIHSAINQSHSPIEIIIVNNLPNTQTKEIAKTMAEESKIPLYYIEHEMKGRGSFSYNLGASKATGDYLAFLDDDDLWEINYLKEMSFLIKEKNSKITYACTWKIKNNIKTPHKSLPENLKMKDFLLSNPGCQVSNLIIDKNLFIGIGGFDDYVIPSNDKDLIMRLLYFGYTYNVLKKKLVIQNKHYNQQVTDFNYDFLLGMKFFFKKHEWVSTPIIKIKFWIKYFRIYIKILLKVKKK